MVERKKNLTIITTRVFLTIIKFRSAEKLDTNMGAEAEQYSYNILKNWMILSLNILINFILIKKKKSVNIETKKQGLQNTRYPGLRQDSKSNPESAFENYESLLKDF